MNLPNRLTHPLTVWILFAAVFGAVMLGLNGRIPPKPFFKTLWLHPKTIDLPTGVEFAYEFEAPGARICGMTLIHLLAGQKTVVNLKIQNKTRGVQLYEGTFGAGAKFHAKFRPNNAAGDTIRVTYLVAESQKDRFPDMPQGVKRSDQVSYYPIRSWLGGEKLPDDVYQSFIVRYHLGVEWAQFVLVALLAVLLGAAAFDERFAKFHPALIALFGLAAGLVSFHGWTYRYEHAWGYADPDKYGTYAEQMHAYLTAKNPETRREAVEFFRAYPHAQVPFTSAILTGYLLAGWPGKMAPFVHLTGLASLGTCLLLYAFLTRRLRVASGAALLTVLLLGSHVIFLKAFCKVSTDPIGVFFVLLAFVLAHERILRKPGWRLNLAFAANLLILATCRPPGLGWMAFFAGLGFLADVWRERESWLGGGKLRLPGLVSPILQALIFTLPPALILAAMWVGFDWSHNFHLNWEKAQDFRKNSSWSFFFTSSVTIFHFAVLFVLGWRLRDFRQPAAIGALLWISADILLLYLPRAPYYTRLFLPMLPIFMILGSYAVQRIYQRRRWQAISAAALLIAVNAGFVIHQLHIMHLPWPPVHQYIYF